MTDTRASVSALRARLQIEQSVVILQAADAGVLPSSGALARIADLEGALTAVDALVEEQDRPAAQPDMTPPLPASPIVKRESNAFTGTVKWFNATKGFGLFSRTTVGPTRSCMSARSSAPA